MYVCPIAERRSVEMMGVERVAGVMRVVVVMLVAM